MLVVLKKEGTEIPQKIVGLLRTGPRSRSSIEAEVDYTHVSKWLNFLKNLGIIRKTESRFSRYELIVEPTFVTKNDIQLKAILDYLKMGPRTAKQIQNNLGISENYTRLYLETLVQRKYVTPAGFENSEGKLGFKGILYKLI